MITDGGSIPAKLQAIMTAVNTSEDRRSQRLMEALKTRLRKTLRLIRKCKSLMDLSVVRYHYYYLIKKILIKIIEYIDRSATS